eukprot:CAMPEP_0116936214 /NCGR_PEP_ID=MMETSP0467-20121206/30754_1 /TAXON_ID=283647 /ORGANISM="Mesodinium pulex, Strain SPMC105" /LENGTH=131 /DNA_ID=CAMNT_0004617753 /DNA_START=276 /DNA_END=671 /DNA_ORIENTATION=+
MNLKKVHKEYLNNQESPEIAHSRLIRDQKHEYEQRIKRLEQKLVNSNSKSVTLQKMVDDQNSKIGELTNTLKKFKIALKKRLLLKMKKKQMKKKTNMRIIKKGESTDKDKRHKQKLLAQKKQKPLNNQKLK